MHISMLAVPRLCFAAVLGCCGVAGCGDSDAPAPGIDTSTVELHVHSAPSGDYQALHLDVSRVDAHGVLADGRSGWVIFATPDRIFDFTSNPTLDTRLSSQRALPQGHYDKLRFVFGVKSTITLNDGTLHALRVQDGISPGVQVPGSFDATPGTDTEGTANLDQITADQGGRDSSTICVLHNTGEGPPGCDGGADSGSITGTITDGQNGNALSGVALFGEELDKDGRATIVSTAVSNDQGGYTMNMLQFGHTYYVVTRPYVNGVIYTPQASAALTLSQRQASARFDIKLAQSAGVGGVIGEVTPTAASNESDQLNLVQQFTQGDAPWLIVDTTIGQLDLREEYAFSSAPIGRYAVSAARSTVQLDGSVSVTNNTRTAPFDVTAGATANAAVQYP